MASIVKNLVEKIQLNTDSTNAASIASTAYGVCDTSANQAAKTVEMTGFQLLQGVTVHIKFTNKNTASSPTLNVNSTGAKSIVDYGSTPSGTDDETTGWQDGAVVSLTYDGTNWVKNQGYNTNTTYSVVSTSAAGLVPQGSAVVDQSQSTKFLREDGSWQVPSYTTDASLLTSGTLPTARIASGSISNSQLENSSITIANHTINLGDDIDAWSDLGLVDTSMHYIGTSTTTITDGGNQNPTINGSVVSTKSEGDVVIYDDSTFMWTGSTWAALGSSAIAGALPIASGGTGTSTAPNAGGVIYGGTDNSNNVIYASTSAGDAGQVLISGGSAAPSWYEGLSLTSSTSGNTTTYDADFEGTVTVGDDLTVDGDVLPDSTNTYSLGDSTTRWSGIFVGTTNDYGDAYQPIYWNNGVPAVTSPVQYFSWTINANKKGVILTHAALTEDTFPLAIVVTSGEDHLTGPITWNNAKNGSNDQFKLTIPSALSTGQSVSGYCIVAHGTPITPSSSDVT